MFMCKKKRKWRNSLKKILFSKVCCCSSFISPSFHFIDFGLNSFFFFKGVADLAKKYSEKNDDGQTCLIDILDTAGQVR